MNCVENLEGEIWRYVMSEEIGFWPYMVSNMGRVKSLSFSGGSKERLLRQKTERGNYKSVALCRKGEKKGGKNFKVHRLVAFAFLKNPDPENFHFINHRDENPSNNCAENLEWCDSFYNNRYGSKVERFKRTIETSTAWKEGFKRAAETRKTSEAFKEAVKKRSKKVFQYRETDLVLVNTYVSVNEASRRTGFTQGIISATCRGDRKIKTYKGFIWSYEPLPNSTNQLSLFPTTETEKN